MRFRRLRQLSNPYLLTERLLLRALASCDAFAGGRAADFGCGDFRLSKGFLPHLDELIGIDNWLPARFHASTPEGARFYYASVQQAPFRDNAFDTVFCTEVLEHAERPEALMRECFRVLKPGAHAVISVPFNFFVHGAPNDFRRYTIYGLERLAADAGLPTVMYVHVGGGHFSVLNHFLTLFGFPGHPWQKWPARVVVMGLNALSLLAIRLSKPPRSLGSLDPGLNDRTQPLGYVLVVRKPDDVQVDSLEDDFESPVVCPACHHPLQFGQPRVTCDACGNSYPYFEGIPVLADLDELHLIVESTGERIAL